MNNLLLSTTLAICLVTDLKKRKIYNAVLVPSLLLGLLLNIAQNGWGGLVNSTQGMLLGFAILIIPFIFGGLGAGDVKLLATIGTIKGGQYTFYTFLGMALAGGLLAIGVLIKQRRLLKTIKELFKGAWIMFQTGGKGKVFDNIHEKNMIPYGVAIVTGAVYALLMVG